MDGSFSFNIHEYFKIQSNAHREITSKISAKEKEIEVECQSMTEKSEKERREMKTKMMEESSDICELKEKLKQMEGVQYDADVLRDGVLCVSNMYGLIFFSMKRDLFVVPSATIQTRADMPPSRSFGSNITQVSLSPSELYVSVCAGNTVEIFAAKRLKEQPSSAPVLRSISVPDFGSVDDFNFCCRWNKHVNNEDQDMLALGSNRGLFVFDSGKKFDTVATLEKIEDKHWSFDWSPNDNKVALAVNNKIIVYNSSLGTPSHTFPGIFDDSEKSRCLHLHWFRQDSLAVASCEDAESCEEDVTLEVISLNFLSSSITRHGLLESIDADDWSDDTGWAVQQHLIFTVYLPPWDYLLVGSNRSLMVNIFKVQENETVKIDPDTEDGSFILLDGTEFRFTSGLAVCRNTIDPTVLVLTSHGELVACDFKDENESQSAHITAKNSFPSDEVKKQQVEQVSLQVKPAGGKIDERKSQEPKANSKVIPSQSSFGNNLFGVKPNPSFGIQKESTTSTTTSNVNISASLKLTNTASSSDISDKPSQPVKLPSFSTAVSKEALQFTIPETDEALPKQDSSSHIVSAAPEEFTNIISQFDSRVQLKTTNSRIKHKDDERFDTEISQLVSDCKRTFKGAVKLLNALREDSFETMKKSALLDDIKKQISESSGILNDRNDLHSYSNCIRSLELDPVATSNREEIKKKLHSVEEKLEILESRMKVSKIRSKEELFSNLCAVFTSTQSLRKHLLSLDCELASLGCSKLQKNAQQLIPSRHGYGESPRRRKKAAWQNVAELARKRNHIRIGKSSQPKVMKITGIGHGHNWRVEGISQLSEEDVISSHEPKDLIVYKDEAQTESEASPRTGFAEKKEESSKDFSKPPSLMSQFASKLEKTKPPSEPSSKGFVPSSLGASQLANDTSIEKLDAKPPLQSSTSGSSASFSFRTSKVLTTSTKPTDKGSEKSSEVSVANKLEEKTSTFEGLEAFLRRVYTQHVPEKLSTIPDILQKFKGKEHELVTKIEKKYGMQFKAGTIASSSSETTFALAEIQDKKSAQMPSKDSAGSVSPSCSKAPAPPLSSKPPAPPVSSKAPAPPLSTQSPKVPETKSSSKPPMSESAPKPPVPSQAPKPPVAPSAPKPPLSNAPPKPPVSNQAPKPPIATQKPKSPAPDAAPKPPMSVNAPKSSLPNVASMPPVSKEAPKPPVSTASPKPPSFGQASTPSVSDSQSKPSSQEGSSGFAAAKNEQDSKGEQKSPASSLFQGKSLFGTKPSMGSSPFSKDTSQESKPKTLFSQASPSTGPTSLFSPSSTTATATANDSGAGGNQSAASSNMSASADQKPNEVEMFLKDVYSKHMPEKLSTIPNILSKYAGREQELVAKMEKKYNVKFPGSASQTVSPFASKSSGFGGISGQSKSPFSQSSAAVPMSSSQFGKAGSVGASPFSSTPFSQSASSGGGSLFGQSAGQSQNKTSSPFASKPDAAKSTSASPFSTQTPSFGQPSAVGGGFGGQTPASSMGTTPFSTGGFGDFAKPQGSSLFGGGGAGQASFGGPSNTSTSSPFGGSSGSMFGSQSQSQSPASNSSPFKTSMPAFGQTSGIGGASSGAGQGGFGGSSFGNTGGFSGGQNQFGKSPASNSSPFGKTQPPSFGQGSTPFGGPRR